METCIYDNNDCTNTATHMPEIKKLAKLHRGYFRPS